MKGSPAGPAVAVAGGPEPASRGRPRVVIVGGGFGGLAAARALDGADLDVLILDAKNHHCFQPLLYQAATAALDISDIAWPIRHILERQRNATVLMAAVLGVDAGRKLVLSTAGEFAFDWLVLATGSTHSYFGHDQWSACAPSLKTVEDAIDIRSRVLTAFERAESAKTDQERTRCLTFAIVGGGPTGVELAGALAELARRTLPPEFRRSDPKRARILLLEAGPSLLPSFPKSLSDYAQRQLARMGVEVRTGAMVEDVSEDGLVVSGDRIDVGGAILWAAGVRSSPAASWVDAPRDRGGRARVEADLTVPGRPDIFVVGDARPPRGRTAARLRALPAAAKQMGRHVGLTILARLSGDGDSRPFRYRDYGSLATIGRNAAIVHMSALRLTGFPGWLFWSAVHIYFLIGLRSRFFVAASWAWSYVTFHRGARLIVEP